MKRTPVDSSDVVSIGYDPKDRILEVEFREGRIYRYLEVPQDIYDHFLKADSHGGYFNSYINGYFRYRRVEERGAKPKSLAFVTGNSRKFFHLQKACEELGIEIEQLEFDIDEIQSHEPEKVALHKAKAAYRLAGRPVVVNDTFWSVPALGGFPGPYMADMNKWLKVEDWLALMSGKQDRTIVSTSVLVYYDGKKTKSFKKDRWAKIIDEPRGEKGSPIEHIVVAEGFTETLSELSDQGKPSYQADDSIWHEFAKWYNMQRKLRLA
jgi:XTP/dITP diphosphohydrolase